MRNKLLLTVIMLDVFLMTVVSCGPTGLTQNLSTGTDSDNSSKNKPFSEESTAQLVVGDAAPDFGLKDLNGKLVVLSNLRGKKVIVNMWDLTCHGCASEIGFIQDYSRRLSDPGIVLLTVNVYQPADIVRMYMQGNKLTFTVLVDPGKVMPKSYVDAGTPTTYFIDEDGIIRQIKDGMFNSVQEVIDLANSY